MTTHSILGNTRRPDISFSLNGKIEITSRVVSALDMKAGDVIDIMVGNGECYLYISVHASDTRGRHEGKCHPSKHGSRHFRTYSKALCLAILKYAGKCSKASFAVGEVVEINGCKAIPIITRLNLNRND